MSEFDLRRECRAAPSFTRIRRRRDLEAIEFYSRAAHAAENRPIVNRKGTDEHTEEDTVHEEDEP